MKMRRFIALAERYTSDNSYLLQYLKDGEFDPYACWNSVQDWIVENDYVDFLSREIGREIDDIREEEPDIFYRLPKDAQEECAKWSIRYVMTHDPASAPTTAHMSLERDRLLERETWLVHFTDQPEEIQWNGFIYGVDQMDRLGLTKWLPDFDKEQGGYNFAFEANSRDASEAASRGGYGRHAVLFQNSGVRTYHDSDQEYQIIFWGRDVDPGSIVVLRWNREHAVWVVKNPKGGRDPFSGAFDKVVRWVQDHFAQYRRTITTGRRLKESPEDFDLWNPERFQAEQRPTLVGEIAAKEQFSSRLPSCLDMPIKMPGGEFRIPYRNRAVAEFIQRCVEHEKTINSQIDQCHAYLTIDQRFIDPGKTHRRGGAHFDGMQGERYASRLPADHSYVVSDVNPTKFYMHPFTAQGLSAKHHNWFRELAKQTDQSKTFAPAPYTIYMMTAYQMHESPVAAEPGMRTFMRLEFSRKMFDRIGNTKNPLIDTGWNYKDRPIPPHLDQKDEIDSAEEKFDTLVENEEPEQEFYVRFGDLPEGGRSQIGAAPNWVAHLLQTDDHELGVSVYPASWNAGRQRWSIDCDNPASLSELLAQERPAYLVTGEPIQDDDGYDACGMDGEPLLKDVSILRQLEYRQIYVPIWSDDEQPEEFVGFQARMLAGEFHAVLCDLRWRVLDDNHKDVTNRMTIFGDYNGEISPSGTIEVLIDLSEFGEKVRLLTNQIADKERRADGKLAAYVLFPSGKLGRFNSNNSSWVAVPNQEVILARAQTGKPFSHFWSR